MPFFGELAIGPMLHVGLCNETSWQFFIGVLIKTGEKGPQPCPLAVRVPDGDVVVSAPELLADLRPENGQYLAWRWTVTVPRQAEDRWISYEFAVKPDWTLSKIIGRAQEIDAKHSPTGEMVDGICIPGLGRLPRIAAHSCSWFSAPEDKIDEGAAFGRWVSLYDRHMKAQKPPRLADLPGGFHLQVGGGDQIYADSLLKVEFINQLWSLPNASVPPNSEERALDQYLGLYAVRWSAPAMARVLARIPGVFTWDDHEIMDGWGSYGDALQNAKGRQILWRAARRAFEVVQLGGKADFRYPSFNGFALPRGLPAPVRRPAAKGPAVDPHYLQSLSFKEADAELHLLLLDLRSERSMDRVMAAEWQWKDLESWLSGFESATNAPDRLGRT